MRSLVSKQFSLCTCNAETSVDEFYHIMLHAFIAGWFCMSHSLQMKQPTCARTTIIRHKMKTISCFASRNWNWTNDEWELLKISKQGGLEILVDVRFVGLLTKVKHFNGRDSDELEEMRSALLSKFGKPTPFMVSFKQSFQEIGFVLSRSL